MFVSPNFIAVAMALGESRERAASASDATARTGLRRVDWVRLVEDGGRYQAEVVGVGFRLPVTCPISLALAAELIASGVPHVTRSAQPVRGGA
jgi:hypothetical protein